MTTLRAEKDHDVPGGYEPFPPPLAPAEPAPRRSPAEDARTLLLHEKVATLATISDDGSPWASLVVFGILDDGSPALLVSTLAEHGRNLIRDQRASLMVAAPVRGNDPLASGRVTVLGTVSRPTGEREVAAREACLERMVAGKFFVGFRDFSLWVLDVERVRWVGGYGVMGSDSAAAYAAAEPDPTAPSADRAIDHLNEDHGDALLLIGQRLAGYPDATAAKCTAIDRYGVDIQLTTPRGKAPARVGFAEPVAAPDGLRAATVALTQRARAAAEAEAS